MFKDLEYVKINSVNPLYIIINNANGYIEECNGNKYLTLVSTNKSKEIIKKYEELWTKIKDPIKSKLISQMIMVKNIWKLKLIRVMIYF